MRRTCVHGISIAGGKGAKSTSAHPVARKVYDQSISYLQGAVEGAEIGREERKEALKRLAQFSESMFSS